MTAHPRKEPSGTAKWPEDEHPHERLLTRGIHALTEAELIVILLLEWLFAGWFQAVLETFNEPLWCRAA